MKKTTEVFTPEELLFDCSAEKTGEFRTRERKLNYSPDADPDSLATESVREERVVWRHADGREAESWENRE
jgi:hypothetical protein